MTHTLAGHPLAEPPTESPVAVTIQIEHARHRLQRRAAATGIPPAVVDDAVDAAAADFAGATVHAFLGILVERHARARLGL